MNRTEKTRQFFDGIAHDYYRDAYEQPRDRHAYNLALRREACLPLVPRTNGWILDLGCGPGAMTIPLVQSGHRVVSTDFSIEMVAETARRLRQLGEVPYVAASEATRLPFPDGTFTSVVTTGVLEYVPDICGALKEIARVLKPAGVVIATMSLPRRFERLAVRTLARLRGQTPQTTQFIYGRSEFDDVVKSVGLRIDFRQSCTFAPFPLDAILPKSVVWIDKTFGASLNRVDLACDHAKTYIVKATRI